MAWTAPRTWVAGEIVTAAIGNQHWRDNLKEVWREVDYAQITTATTNVTATSAATANTIITGTSLTFEATPLLIEVALSSADKGTNNIAIHVWEDSTDLGQVAFISATGRVPVYRKLRRTPSAAAHQYSVRAWVDAGTGHVYAGGGGAGTDTPAYMRIFQKGS